MLCGFVGSSFLHFVQYLPGCSPEGGLPVGIVSCCALKPGCAPALCGYSQGIMVEVACGFD